MSKSIENTLPDDRGGAIGSNRGDYQKSWALCKLLQLDGAEGDFAIIFEHHEDVLVSTSSTDLKSVDFYQIKTSDAGPWRLRKLLSRKKMRSGPGFSILGTMYRQRVKFGEQARTLNLISNAPYRIPLDSGDDSERRFAICAREFDLVCRNETSSGLGKEHGLIPTDVTLDCINLHWDVMHIYTHQDTALSKVCSYLEEHQELFHLRPRVVHQMLLAEIARLSDVEGDAFGLDELLAKKGITKGRLQAMLLSAPGQTSPTEKWGEIKSRLNAEMYDVLHLKKLQLAWNRLQIERKNPTNEVVRRLYDRVSGLTEQWIATGREAPQLSGLMEQALEAILPNVTPLPAEIDHWYIRAIIVDTING